MTDPSSDTSDGARAALESVAAMRAAGVRRGLPPRWFGLVCALWIGAMVASAGVQELRDHIWVFAVVLVCVGAGIRKRAGAWLRAMGGGIGLGAQIAINAIVLGLLALSLLGGARLGWPWAPPAAGIAAVLAVYTAFELKRRLALASAAFTESR